MSEWERAERDSRIESMARQIAAGARPSDVADAWPDATAKDVYAAKKRASRGRPEGGRSIRVRRKYCKNCGAKVVE